MNMFKLAEIVKNLADNGFETEADDLAQAMDQTPELQSYQTSAPQANEKDPNTIANEIINDPEIQAALENIVGGMLHELFEDPNSSEKTLSELPVVFTELVSD